MHETKQLNPTPIFNYADFLFDQTKEGLVKPKAFVDKTAEIALLIQQKGFYSLCRPRRFGKTSTLKIIEDLFTNGLKNWQDCKIAQESLFDDSKKYPVLFLDFSRIFRENIELFVANFKRQIVNFASKHSLTINTEIKDPISLLELCFIEFEKQDAQQIVVLIDEYDLPLIESMYSEQLNAEVSSLITNFYRTLKSFEVQIRFLLVTGVNRVSNLSVFSGFNNIKDLSFEPQFASIVGYTEQELLANFELPLHELAKFYNLDFDHFMCRLKAYYNGYCFDKMLATTVFNTFDINSFLTDTLNKQQDEFPCYWSNIGSLSAFVRCYFQFNSDKVKNFLEEILALNSPISLNEIKRPCNFKDTPVHIFMFNAGYLTLSQTITDEQNKVRLAFPNQIMHNFVLNELLEVVKAFDIPWLSFLSKSSINIAHFFDKNISNEQRKQMLSDLLVSAGTKANEVFGQESQLRALLQIIFCFSGLQVFPEVPIVGGRIDLIVEKDQVGYIFELKVFKSLGLSTKECLKLSRQKLDEAILQIKNREYFRVAPHLKVKYFIALVGDCSTARLTELEIMTKEDLLLNKSS